MRLVMSKKRLTGTTVVRLELVLFEYELIVHLLKVGQVEVWLRHEKTCIWRLNL